MNDFAAVQCLRDIYQEVVKFNIIITATSDAAS